MIDYWLLSERYLLKFLSCNEREGGNPQTTVYDCTSHETVLLNVNANDMGIDIKRTLLYQNREMRKRLLDSTLTKTVRDCSNRFYFQHEFMLCIALALVYFCLGFWSHFQKHIHSEMYVLLPINKLLMCHFHLLNAETFWNSPRGRNRQWQRFPDRTP